MDYFKLGKYQSKYENTMYLTKILVSYLSRPMSIDKLFVSMGKDLPIPWSADIEQAMLLALSFAHSVGIIEENDGLLQRGSKS